MLEFRIVFHKENDWKNLLYFDGFSITKIRGNAFIFESQEELELYVLNNYHLFSELSIKNEMIFTVEKVEPTYPWTTPAFKKYMKELAAGEREFVTEKEYNAFK